MSLAKVNRLEAVAAVAEARWKRGKSGPACDHRLATTALGKGTIPFSAGKPHLWRRRLPLKRLSLFRVVAIFV